MLRRFKPFTIVDFAGFAEFAHTFWPFGLHFSHISLTQKSSKTRWAAQVSPAALDLLLGWTWRVHLFQIVWVIRDKSQHAASVHGTLHLSFPSAKYYVLAPKEFIQQELVMVPCNSIISVRSHHCHPFVTLGVHARFWCSKLDRQRIGHHWFLPGPDCYPWA